MCLRRGGGRNLLGDLECGGLKKTLADLHADDARTWEEQKKLTEIPAPPFKEAARAQYMLKRFKEAGLRDAYIDSEGNVMGLRKSGGGPKLVVSAHMDTVFAEGTDVKVKEIDGIFLTLLGLSGLHGVSRPLLEKRALAVQ